MKFDCREQLTEGLTEAKEALEEGKLVVMPTDTVYGIAAHAFDPIAVQRLLEAKVRGRLMPPPVLIPSADIISALAIDVPGWLNKMLVSLWPGALTVVLRAQPSLTWDLGETHGTVALRVPADERALTLLREVGPLAVSSANLSGQAPATTIEQAEEMLADKVDIYLDGGPTSGETVSTILDATSSTPRLLREGAVDLAALHEFNNTIEPVPGSESEQ